MSLGRFPLSNSCSRQHSKLTFKLFTVFAEAVGEDGTRGRERGREGKRERQKKRERVRERENESERERWDQFVVAEAVGEDRAAGREGRREGGWERQKDRDPQYHLVFNETPSRRILQYRKRKKTSSSLPRRWARTAREGGGKAKQRDRARERERERGRGRERETYRNLDWCQHGQNNRWAERRPVRRCRGGGRGQRGSPRARAPRLLAQASPAIQIDVI